MIAIIDYEAGNLTSVKRALDSLGIDCVVTPDPAVIARAQRIIFPGVGHASAAMAALSRRGLDTPLREAVARGTPVLGICLGTQIILSRSQEGETECLGLIPGMVKKFMFDDPAFKIPHMGWNAVGFVRPHPVFAGLEPGTEFYFVHSYYPCPDNEEAVVGTCEYGIRFTAAIGCGSLVATQFHPEKSGRPGLRILENFSRWDGRW